MWQRPFIHPNDKNDRVFQSLSRVQRNQGHGVAVLFSYQLAILTGLGSIRPTYQRNVFQEKLEDIL